MKANYIYWNNLIGSYFFNEENQFKDVWLYADLAILTKIAGKEYTESEQVLCDYIESCKSIFGVSNRLEREVGQEWYKLPILDNSDLLHILQGLYSRRNDKVRQGLELNKYPLYLGYLYLIVLALSEGNGKSNYKRINSFLQTYNFPKLKNQTHESNWNQIWESLESWSIQQGGETGWFNAVSLLNSGWTYLSLPLSQSLLTPQQVKCFEKVFSKAGLAPGNFYEDQVFKAIALQNASFLHLNRRQISILESSDANLFINRIKFIYAAWNGEVDEENTSAGVVDYSVNCSLRVCFTLNLLQGKAIFFFRLFSNGIDYPEELQFNVGEGPIHVTQSNSYFSDKIEGLKVTDELALIDRYYNWKATYKPKQLYIFIEAKDIYGINGFVEIPKLQQGVPNYLLFNSDLKNVLEWSKENEGFSLLNATFQGVPNGFTLVRFTNFSSGCPGVEQLNTTSNLEIEFINGVQVDTRKYNYYPMPRILARNLSSTDCLYINYDDGTCTELSRSGIFYDLPLDLKFDLPFSFQIESNNTVNKGLKYSIVRRYNVFGEDNKPYRRNTFGIVDNNAQSYKEAFNICSNNYPPLELLSNFKYALVNSGALKIKLDIFQHSYSSTINDILIYLLYIKKKLSRKEFFSCYELQRKLKDNDEKQLKNQDKWAILQHYANLGYCDFSFDSEYVLANKPTFLQIPNSIYPAVFLSGTWNDELINKLKLCSKAKQVRLTIKNNVSDKVILPSYIELVSSHISQIHEVAQECGVDFNLSHKHQIELLHFSGRLSDLELEDDRNFVHFKSGLFEFNPYDLAFNTSFKVTTSSIPKLIEYRQKAWDRRCWLYQEGKKYKIDKNWGRYYVLSKLALNICYYDNKGEKLFIPVKAPLPSILAEGFTKLSGKSYDLQTIQGGLYQVFDNIPRIVARSILKEKLNQEVQEANIK